MKETKLTKDAYGSVKLNTMPVNSFIKLKLNKGGKALVKEYTRKSDGGKFTIHVLGCIHNGEEVYVQITPAVSKQLAFMSAGDTAVIYALPSQLKGGKAYSVTKEEASSEDTAASGQSNTEMVFDKIITQLKLKGLSLNDIDEAVIVRALSGHFGFTLENAEQVAPSFFPYAKGKL